MVLPTLMMRRFYSGESRHGLTTKAWRTLPDSAPSRRLRWLALEAHLSLAYVGSRLPFLYVDDVVNIWSQWRTVCSVLNSGYVYFLLACADGLL